MSPPSLRRTVATVLLPFTIAFLLQEVFRTVIATLLPDIAADFSLGAGGLGFLTAIYFLPFAAAQLPNGMMLDRIGPRRLIAILLLIAGLGAGLFSIAQNMATLAIARALIGLGMSACLMGAFKANAVWFPPQRLALLNGIVIAVGSLGGLIATTPVRAFLQVADWRDLFRLLALLAVIVAAIILVVGPGLPPAERVRAAAATAYYPILASRPFWRLAPIAGLAQAVLVGYQGLWVAPWLRDVVGRTVDDYVGDLLWIALAMALGNLASGFLASALGRLGLSQNRIFGLLMSLFLAVQLLLLVDSGRWSSFLWLAFAAIGATSILSFAMLAEHFPDHLLGRANSLLNLVVFIAAFVVQFGIGRIIDAFPPAAGGGFPIVAHHAALAIALLAQAVALLWFWVARRGRA
jgi:MFS family permease